jgi:hypothetical protein
MSQDTAPRYRYAVSFNVVVVVDAETPDAAIDYAEERLDNYIAHDENLGYAYTDVEREDA